MAKAAGEASRKGATLQDVRFQGATFEGVTFDDLRTFIAACQEIDGWRLIEGADWDCEIGALVEATAELIPDPPLLLFDNIKGYPPGYRVVSLTVASRKRAALALGLPTDKSILELVRLAARKVMAAQPIPPKEVATGPVMENILLEEEEKVDLLQFPVLRFHAQDGGRYLGTGDVMINRDPDTGFLNMGTYRMQVHERNLLGLWMSPGQHGRLVCQRYWDRGESCPVVAAYGVDPLLFMASHTKIPWGKSELEFAGGLRERPVEVIPGPITGLPIPAHAEVAIEGEVPPPEVDSRSEGPFGEWPGYYSGGTLGTGKPQPVIRVKALYHRNQPILLDEAPLWPGAPKYALPIMAGILWDQLESAGIQDVVGVFAHTSFFVVVAIRQRFAGHAKQAGHAALSCAATARNGRYVVVVDEDIDPTDFKEVLWAMETRVDPARDIEIVEGCWSTPLDPRMPAENRASGDHTNNRAIFYAVRPYAWRDKFPKVSRSG
ncbi:MAG: UbiD family decarboxylase, partial [Acidobacteria bacterium]|nr:UbiD family decarboxylase [Acidobacteriota bacterium]